jgi:hypothetical protein
MQALGRFLEALGVVVVPMALVLGWRTGSMRAELLVLAAGAALFWLGRALAQRRGE